ncbi:MAG: hypothetical protein U1F57_09085 [bacterium]
MKSFKYAAFSAVLLSILSAFGCSNNDAPTGPAPAQNTPPVIRVEDQNTVSTVGCDGISGDLLTAQSSLKQGELKTANCIASKIFNDSVAANPDKPDTQAAFIAGQARVGLLVETPEVTYLLTTDPSHTPLKASDYFGTSGDIDKLGEIFHARWAYTGPLSDTQGTIYNFLKAHQNMGHTANNLLDKVASLISSQAPDLHVLSKAIAKDVQFNGTIKEFVQLATEVHFTYTEGGIANAYFNLARVAAKLAPHYSTGLDQADSLTDGTLAALVADLNSPSRLLSLRGTNSELDALPLVRLSLQGIILAISNSQAAAPQSWSKDLLPKETSAQLNILVIAQELLPSLDDDKTVWLAPADYKVGINLKRALSSLPDSATITDDVVKLNGSHVEPNEDFFKKFVSGFVQEL